jgi:hypothetical protein
MGGWEADLIVIWKGIFKAIGGDKSQNHSASSPSLSDKEVRLRIMEFRQFCLRAALLIFIQYSLLQ